MRSYLYIGESVGVSVYGRLSRLGAGRHHQIALGLHAVSRLVTIVSTGAILLRCFGRLGRRRLLLSDVFRGFLTNEGNVRLKYYRIIFFRTSYFEND